jgi:Zn-dependent peptidase ImmA (M78 family)
MPQKPTKATSLSPPDPARMEEIAALAESVSYEYSHDTRFSPDPILKEHNITISYGNYGSAFDGMLEHRSEKFHIFCNLDRVESVASPRARFTVAHELGHYFIDEHRNVLSSGSVPAHKSRSEFESNLLVEREADHFASHLLMPPKKFEKIARAQKPGIAGILAIAKHFNSSVTSTAIRYVQSELVPCVVVKWSPTEYQWQWMSKEPFGPGLRYVGKSLTALPTDCPTRKALSGETVPACGYFEAGTTTASWFPFLSDGDSRNGILKEQAMYLGRFGAISLLFPADFSLAPNRRR